ncbi:MAG: zinc metallopeptidase [Bacillota bacterium]|nr:zinc metallopeptidase [Bacillota bacterium]
MGYFFDSSYLILIPALIIAAYAQYKVSSTFNKYSKVLSSSGFSGADAARYLLDAAGLNNIPIEIIGGKLSDHYDPSSKVMRLSKEVYYSTSVASIGVAAHETGHAIQHSEGYAPLNIRNSIVPAVNFASSASWIIFLLGIVFFHSTMLINLGIFLFLFVVIFQLITLPVEFNASNRALNYLEQNRILDSNEINGARSVLRAAAMTYVAATLTAIAQLVRLILLSQSSRRRD